MFTVVTVVCINSVLTADPVDYDCSDGEISLNVSVH